MTNEKCDGVLEWRCGSPGGLLGTMANKDNSGCRIAALIVAGIVFVFALIVVGIFWMYQERRVEVVKEYEMAMDRASAEVMATGPEQGDTLELDESDWESLTPLGEGEPVSVKQFVLMMEDPRATELARETFRQRADGAQATWRMSLQDVWSEDGTLGASLSVPYALKRGFSTSMSSLSVRAEFGPDQRDALIGLRQGDPVTVTGTLDLSDDRTWIREARVVTGE